MPAAASWPALGALLAALLSACTGGDPAPDPTDRPTDAPVESPATVGGGCRPPEHPAVQPGGHLLPGATPPVPYSSTPPTSGWHPSGLVSPGVHDEPLSEPQQVTALEGGRIVVSWRELPDGARRELEAFAGIHANGVVSTPYDALEPGQVAFTAWGVVQRCHGFDDAAASVFLEEYAGRGPAH
jgi:hypothetical protein